MQRLMLWIDEVLGVAAHTVVRKYTLQVEPGVRRRVARARREPGGSPPDPARTPGRGTCRGGPYLFVFAVEEGELEHGADGWRREQVQVVPMGPSPLRKFPVTWTNHRRRVSGAPGTAVSDAITPAMRHSP